jgi:hypothetical protein
VSARPGFKGRKGGQIEFDPFVDLHDARSKNLRDPEFMPPIHFLGEQYWSRSSIGETGVQGADKFQPGRTN